MNCNRERDYRGEDFKFDYEKAIVIYHLTSIDGSRFDEDVFDNIGDILKKIIILQLVEQMVDVLNFASGGLRLDRDIFTELVKQCDSIFCTTAEELIRHRSCSFGDD